MGMSARRALGLLVFSKRFEGTIHSTRKKKKKETKAKKKKEKERYPKKTPRIYGRSTSYIYPLYSYLFCVRAAA